MPMAGRSARLGFRRHLSETQSAGACRAQARESCCHSRGVVYDMRHGRRVLCVYGDELDKRPYRKADSAEGLSRGIERRRSVFRARSSSDGLRPPFVGASKFLIPIMNFDDAQLVCRPVSAFRHSGMRRSQRPEREEEAFVLLRFCFFWGGNKGFRD